MRKKNLIDKRFGRLVVISESEKRTKSRGVYWVCRCDCGIFVCDEWKDFSNFLNDMGERPKDTSIDRIDGNLGYCKENCRWASKTQQANNTRRNSIITYKGETKTIAEWATEKGLRYDALYSRLKRYGWSIEKAIETNCE